MTKESKELRRIAEGVESLSARHVGRRTDVDPARMMPLRARVLMKFATSEGKSARATTARRSFPIMAYVGPNGGGKSLAMVKDTLPSLDRGRSVLSTVRILDAETGEDHPAFIPFTSFDQLLDAEHCDVLMDEIVGIAGTREASRLDSRVQNVLVQLRRRDVVLRWSAPSWSRADKIIREVTQAVTECRGFYARRPSRSDTDRSRLWSPKRLFNFRMFDTVEFEDWTAGKRDRAPVLANEWFYGERSLAFSSYDTLDPVQMVSAPNSDGMCESCGGKVKARYCSCGNHGETAAHVVPIRLAG